MAVVRKNLEKPDLDVVIVMTQRGYTSRHGVPAHPASWWEEFCWWLRMAWNGGGGSEWRRLGVEWWTLVVQRETDNDEMEKERMRERSPTNSLHLSRCFESWVLLI